MSKWTDNDCHSQESISDVATLIMRYSGTVLGRRRRLQDITKRTVLAAKIRIGLEKLQKT